MTGRPEGTSGGYNDRGPDDYDQDAWREFTPWRPGDPSTRDEAPTTYAAGFDDVGRYRPSLDEDDGPGANVSKVSAGQNYDRPRSRWWTETKPEQFGNGDRVSTRTTIGGAVFSHVPAGTEGRVTGTRSGLLGGDFATVEFANGYTEEVSTDQLRRETGWF